MSQPTPDQAALPTVAPSAPDDGTEPAPSPLASPPEKHRRGRMVVIIVLSLALIGVAAFLVQRLVFAHRASSYCQIYINLPDKSQSVNDGLADQSSADMAAIADSFAGLADLLIELSQAGPPAAAVSPLDQSISALETMSTAALEGSDRFAAVYLDQLPTMTDALKAVDTVSLAYCN